MLATPYELPLSQLIEELPAPERLERVRADTNASCFIGICGFEARCLAAVRRLKELGWCASKGVCVKYNDTSMETENAKHYEAMAREISALIGGGVPATISHDDHHLDADFGSKLIELLREMDVNVDDPSVHIVVDITVGSSRLLLEGLHALFQCKASVTLVYSESARYRPFFSEYLEHVEEQRLHVVPPPEFLTHGVDRVEVLRRFPGRYSDARPALVIVFPSFSFTRSSAIIEELSPSRVQWIFGVPHLVENRWRLDAQKAYHRGLVDKSHRECYVSTFDYRETLEVLENVYRKRRDNYSVFIASLGSKMQKVGQVLFHMMRPEAAAVVSIPRIWDADRFSSDEPRAVFALQFGACEALQAALRSTTRLRM